MRRVIQAGLIAALLGSAPVLAQASPEPVAELLAAIRVLKLQCRVTPLPQRLIALVEEAGYSLQDFLPGGRFDQLVQSQFKLLRSPVRSDRREFCTGLAERVRASPLNQPRVATATRSTSSRSGLVNLNRASLEELNSLGAGMIGRTIIYGRPYSSPEDLLERRLLNARDFARIRDRVTVR